MTATFVETTRSAPVSEVLRDHVRSRLEQEYLRLRAVDRPALLETFAADEAGIADTTVKRALAITDYRLAAISDFLRASTSRTLMRRSARTAACWWIGETVRNGSCSPL